MQPDTFAVRGLRAIRRHFARGGDRFATLFIFALVLLFCVASFLAPSKQPVLPTKPPLLTRSPTKRTPAPKQAQTPAKRPRSAWQPITPAPPTLTPNDLVDSSCTVTMHRDHELQRLLQIHLRASDGAACVPHIESLPALLPLRDVDVKCPRNRRRWFTLPEHVAHIDWQEQYTRKRSIATLYGTCRPQPPANPLLVYIDINSKDYAQSVRFFRETYPNARNFIVHAYDVDPNHAKDPVYSDPSNHIFFHNYFAWNETGFVTFIKDRPVPQPGDEVDAVQAALDERPQRFVFHRDRHGLTREDVPSGVPDENLMTVPALAITDILFSSAGVQDKDFVVLKLDVNGNERMLIEFLVVNSALHLIDELMLVCHSVEMDPLWPNEKATPESCQSLIMTLREAGVYVHEWYS